MDALDPFHGGNAAAARVIERLAAREASRKAEADMQKASRRQEAGTGDKADKFIAKWRYSEALVSTELERLENQPAEHRNAVDSSLLSVSSAIADLEQEVAEAAFYLPTYSLVQLSAAVKAHKQRIEALKAAVPRKKFSFSKKTGRPPQTLPAAVDIPTALPTAATTTTSTRVTFADGRGLEGLRHQTVVKNAEELAGGDFTLHDLESCRIFLQGPMSALRMRRMRDCKVYAGPVAGASFVDDVERCTLMVATAQFRIHSTKATDVYLRVRSNPIIEACSDLRFAPYEYQYPGSAEQLGAIGLAEDSGLWAKVNDFDWLRSTPSPNWSILDASGRTAAESAETAGSGSA